MGFLRKIFNASNPPSRPEPPPRSQPPPPPPRADTPRWGRVQNETVEALFLNAHTDNPDEMYKQEVVGESNYQEALWEAVGSRDAVENRRHPVRVTLIWEHDNPYDPNAIAVHAETRRGYQRVGYLSRAWASRFREDFEALEARGYKAGVCEGQIVGGFPQANGRASSLGIWLNLALPGAILPPEDEDEG